MGTEPAAGAEGRGSGAVVVAALCVASFVAALNFFAATPFYPLMSRDLATTVPLLGQVATLMIGVSAGLGLAIGPLADRSGYRRPLVIGVLAIAVNLIGSGLAPSYPVLLGLSLVGGAGDALVFGLPLAIAGARFRGDARRRAIGWTIGALSGAPIVGVPILTTIGAAAGWRTALVAAGVGAAGAAGLVAAALPPDGRRPTTGLRVREVLAAYAPLLADAPTLRLYGSTVLRTVTWFGLLTYLGAFLGAELGLGTRQIGLVYVVAGAGYATGGVAAGRLRTAAPRTAVAAACAVGGVAVGAVLLLAGGWTTVGLLVVASLASSAAGVGTASLLAAESPAGPGTTMVLNGSALNLGAAGGAALGGVLIAAGGYGALGVGLPTFALVAAALARWPAAGRRTGRPAAG